jgi:hypothetical protein
MPKRPYKRVADSWLNRTLSHPTRGRAERFKRDILPLLLTRQAAAAFAGKSSVPTVFIAEQW